MDQVALETHRPGEMGTTETPQTQNDRHYDNNRPQQNYEDIKFQDSMRGIEASEPINQTDTFEDQRIQNSNNSNSGQDSSGEVFMDQDLPIQFEKRTIPKPRTQSVQSVLSSVSLRSLVHQSVQKKQAFIPPPSQQHSQPQFINTKTHIQAPAIAASSKRRTSFEIGQRLPFHKEAGDEEAEALVSDNEFEINPEHQRKLTDDALKRLSALSKFTPAEVDLKMGTKQASSVESDEKDRPVRLLQRNGSASSVSPEFPRLGLNRNPSSTFVRTSASSPSLARRPSSNPSSASKKREDLLSTTTSTQNLLAVPHKNIITPSPLHKEFHGHSEDKDESAHGDENLSQSRKSFESLQTISDPKRPMYVPAVLRQSHTNLKPEDLQHINEQNSKRSKNMLSNAATSLRSQTSHWKLSFDSSNKNSPTRAHWRRDPSRETCAKCSKPFTFFERRHHCRHCGDIFCAEHTSNLLKLGNDAQFTIAGSGILCKVCDGCYNDYEDFLKSKFGSDATINGSTRRDIPKGQDRKKSVVDNAMGQSVPADWSWSSF